MTKNFIFGSKQVLNTSKIVDTQLHLKYRLSKGIE